MVLEFVVLGAAIGGILVWGASKWDHSTGYNAAARRWEAHHNKVVSESKAKHEKERTTLTAKINELKGKNADLEGQARELTAKHGQTEDHIGEEIAEGIAERAGELKTKFDLQRQALEPKIRAEAEAKAEAKINEIETDAKKRIDAFVDVALDHDEERIELWKMHPLTSTLEVLMKAKGNKAAMEDLRTAADLGLETFEKVVATKYQNITQGRAEVAEKRERPLKAKAAEQILALLRLGPQTQAEIVQNANMPKSTASEALKQLSDDEMVEKDPETGAYHVV